MLDLDHFKALNDTFGHAEGDRVLQATATALSRTVGEAGFVARVGGEEFALVLPGAGHARPPPPRRALPRRAGGDLAPPGRALACSAGVAAYPAHADEVARLLHAADGALYWAKRSGRDRVRVFDPSHVVALSLHEQRREVEALLADAAPITPAFQPVMEVATGRVAGYEALARFAARARPPAATCGSPRRTAAGSAPRSRRARSRAALAVPGRPAGTFLALNVSPAALLSPEVKRALPFELDGIVIELTEHEAFHEDGALELELAALRERGARIALDDAGAGYAGLQQLIRLRPEIVKVDRSLVAGIHEDAVQARPPRGARPLRGHDRRRRLRRGRRGARRAARARRLRRHLRAGLRARAPGAGLAGDPGRRSRRRSRRPTTTACAPAGATEAASLGEMTEVLARARTIEELKRALDPVTHVLGAEEAALSRLDTGGRLPGRHQRPRLVGRGPALPARGLPDDRPRARRAGDRPGDRRRPGERPGRARGARDGRHGRRPADAAGVRRCATIALLEIYRRAPQAWTNTQVDRARVLANHIAASLARVIAREPRRPASARPAAAPLAALATGPG